MPGVFVPGVFITGVFVEDVVTGPPILATLTFAGPGVGGATPVGTATILALQTVPRLYPDKIFALHTLAGLRLFGERMIPEEIASTDLGRYSSLEAIGPLDLRTVPIGNDLPASLAASEQSTWQVTLRNEEQFFGRLVMREPVLCAPAGAFLYYGAGHIYQPYRGQISRIVIRKDATQLELEEP